MNAPATALPIITQLNPGQQMGICCAHCGRYLGASGQRWGEVRTKVGTRTFLFLLWICDACAPDQAVPGRPAPKAQNRAPDGTQAALPVIHEPVQLREPGRPYTAGTMPQLPIQETRKEQAQ
ncbi:hypothetical protein ACGFZQ_27605 [Streptomyces sp. NPDC048254]|uniref:hypothetical protein n=1 Tax=Streptomyces sp. NPDC048254 TaxID=3365525 RepID=UPI003716F688